MYFHIKSVLSPLDSVIIKLQLAFYSNRNWKYEENLQDEDIKISTARQIITKIGKVLDYFYISTLNNQS